MSTKVEVLCPNGHRITVKTNPNTKLLQILEEACSKKGFQPSSDYELRHGIGRKVVDPTLTMRYAGLANNAKLELVKASQSRATGGTVIVALQTDSGRFQESFSCNTSLWDILLHWDNQVERSNEVKLTAPGHMTPVCVYMSEEVVGEFALRETSLQHLGLLSGRAIVRFLLREVDEKTLQEIKNKILKANLRKAKLAEQQQQHEQHVPENVAQATSAPEPMDVTEAPVPSAGQPPISTDLPCMRIFPSDVAVPTLQPQVIAPELPRREVMRAPRVRHDAPPQPNFSEFKFPEATKGKDLYQNELSEACKEDFKPCDREMVVYNVNREGPSIAVDDDIPPDFFEVTEKDLRMLMADQQKKLLQESDQPLMTQSMKKALNEMKLEKYSRAILKIHFPEKVVLQAVFRPRETVFAIEKFVKSILDDAVPFYLYTSPPKNILKDKTQTLIEANLVPMSVVYFGSDLKKDFYLSKSLLQKMSSEREAIEVIIKHMPTESKDLGVVPTSVPVRVPGAGSAKSDGHIPKWLKTGKK